MGLMSCRFSALQTISNFKGEGGEKIAAMIPLKKKITNVYTEENKEERNPQKVEEGKKSNFLS